MLLVQMARTALIDPVSGQSIDGSEMLADPDRANIPYVFATDGSWDARSPANRIILDRKYGSPVRPRVLGHLDATKAWETHCIIGEAISAIDSNDLASFVRAREQAIVRQERMFLGEFDLKVGDAERSDEEIDVDDD
jgi:hypothetical protein